MDLVKVQDQEHLVRDMSTRAVLNTDRAGLNEYYRRRDAAKKEKEEQQRTVSRIENIEKDMAEIKELLRAIAPRLTND
jgi:hypothetical protein